MGVYRVTKTGVNAKINGVLTRLNVGDTVELESVPEYFKGRVELIDNRTFEVNTPKTKTTKDKE